jgi:hypothetical protein
MGMNKEFERHSDVSIEKKRGALERFSKLEDSTESFVK